MKCLFPSAVKHSRIGHFIEHRCGQCANCRTTRAQEWTGRLLLESYEHETAIFVTLTYETAPEGYSLSKVDCQLFLKRLRDRIKPLKIRYFLVGEYGPKTHRPHYHAIIFGLDVDSADLIETAWGHGYTQTAEITTGRVSYCAKYCLKKMTHPDDFPDGRVPEFSLMSRNPGIGHGYIPKMVEGIKKHNMKKPPNTFRVGPKRFPIDPYMKKRLEELSGVDDYGLGDVLNNACRTHMKMENAPPEELVIQEEKNALYSKQLLQRRIAKGKL